MKHLIILLFSTILFGACIGHGYQKDKEYSNSIHHRGTKKVGAKDIEILKATKNAFQPGVVGVAGTTYSFDLYTKAEGITFGKVWLSDTKTFATNAVDVETKLRPKTTLNRKISFNITDPNNNKAVGEKLPIQFYGEAVIQYFINGQAKYLIVKEIKELERKIYD